MNNCNSCKLKFIFIRLQFGQQDFLCTVQSAYRSGFVGDALQRQINTNLRCFNALLRLVSNGSWTVFIDHVVNIYFDSLSFFFFFLTSCALGQEVKKRII